jgi:hypothetical protein
LSHVQKDRVTTASQSITTPDVGKQGHVSSGTGQVILANAQDDLDELTKAMIHGDTVLQDQGGCDLLTGALKMRYSPNSHAPLVQMSALQIACALFGMGSHVSARHVDAGAQIGCRPKNRLFFNYNLRAVSYPKYDLSEAAACRIIDTVICGGWLNEEGYQTAGGGRTMNADDVRANCGRQRRRQTRQRPRRRQRRSETGRSSQSGKEIPRHLTGSPPAASANKF